MPRDSIFHALYYGSVAPWEGRVDNPSYKNQSKKSLSLYDQVRSLLNDDGKKLLDEFLDENSKLTCCFEEEKFKDGFILGTRLMIEILQDTRFLKEGE